MLPYIRTAYNNGMESGDYVPLASNIKKFIDTVFAAYLVFQSKDIKPTKMFLTSSDYARMLQDGGNLITMYDPEQNYEMNNGGRKGSLIGMEVYSDNCEYVGDRFIEKSVLM